MFRFRRALALSAVSLLALGSCGDDDVSPGDSAAVETSAPPVAPPATTAASDPPDTVVSSEVAGPADAPKKIVSLSPSATETLYAIGAADQVIAVDSQSNYPPESASKKTELSGYEPNVEAIAAFEPDLVIHDGTTDLGSQLDALDIPQMAGVAPEDFDDVYVQIEQLGAATGHVAEAAELVAEMQTDIDAAIAQIPTLEVPLTYYHELDNTYFSVNSNTFIGQVYGLFGMRNIADTSESTTPYPQLSAEFIISQNPDMIFLGDADYGESAETVAARPGWDVITAVANGAIVPVSADITSRWGPRVVEFIEIVAEAIETAAVPA
jgi:iron complex transport system substrate-binding protein